MNKILLGLAALLGLVGCGGGGGGERNRQPVLSVSPSSISLTGTVGADPVESEFTVRNSGAGTAAYRVSSELQGLGANPVSGSLAAGQTALIRLTYTCASEGTFDGTVRITAGQQTAAVSVTTECQPQADSFVYPNGPQLPADLAVPTPWHLTNVGVELNDMPESIESFCTTFAIDGEVESDINFYFSPFNSRINEIQFYGGIQTRIDGLNADGAFVRRNRGAIFSRWKERDLEATMPVQAATPDQGGLNQSLGNEGDFISVRNDFTWAEGRYRLCLRKGDTIDGDPLPADYKVEDIHFAWGTYEHTWVRMEATDLESGITRLIGALAFPGARLTLRNDNILFAEIYGLPTPFLAINVPRLTITVENFTVNGAILPYRRVGAHSNTIPGQGDEPKLTRIRYDTAESSIRIEVGEFTGRFGVVRTIAFPSAPGVESLALVTAENHRFVASLWDGRELVSGELPKVRFNMRADPVDAAEVASTRLELSGPVSLSRLTNDEPYLLSGGSTGLTLPLGDYTLVATPYPEADGRGEEGATLKAGFSVTAARAQDRD